MNLVCCLVLFLAALPALAAEEPKPPRTDLYGDPLPPGAVARLGTERLRHAGYLRGIAFTPDGKSLVSAAMDGVRVWEAATGRPLHKFAAYPPPFRAVLSPDGRRILLADSFIVGSSLKVWDVATGKQIHELGGLSDAVVCFSPDGKRIAEFGNENYIQVKGKGGIKHISWKLRIWNADTEKLENELAVPPEQVQSLTFAKDGKTLLLGGEKKTISIRDAANGKELRRLRNLPADVHTLVLSPSGDRVAFIELWTKKSELNGIERRGGTRVFLCDFPSGVERRRWTLPTQIDARGELQNGLEGLAFSSDGEKLVAWQRDGPIRVWETSTGKEARFLPESRSHNGGAAFSPDGRTLAVGEGGRTIRLLDAASGAERVKAKGHRGAVESVAIAVDGLTAVTATDAGIVHRWDLRTGRELGRLLGHTKQVHALRLSTDGRKLWSASLDDTLRLWDVDAGTNRLLLEGRALHRTPILLSHDEKMLIVGDGTKTLLLLNPATGETLRKLTMKSRIISCAVAEKPLVVTALAEDRSICRWEAASGRRLPDRSLPPDRAVSGPLPEIGSGPWGCMLSPDSRFVAHSEDDRFLLFDVNAQRLFHRTSKLSNPASRIAFAPDGRTLAWAEQTGVVHWLELATWSERVKWDGHAGMNLNLVNALTFSADSRLLISGANDATALVWDLYDCSAMVLSAEQRDACWIDLGDKEAAKAHRAVCRLIAAPSDALTLLRLRLKLVQGRDAKDIERLVADLDAEEFAVREKATKELRNLDDLADSACRKAMASKPSLEARRRLQRLLAEIEEQRWRPSPEQLRQLRSIEVLERIATLEAKALLTALAEGAEGAWQSREAAAAVGRLTATRGRNSP